MCYCWIHQANHILSQPAINSLRPNYTILRQQSRISLSQSINAKLLPELMLTYLSSGPRGTNLVKFQSRYYRFQKILLKLLSAIRWPFRSGLQSPYVKDDIRRCEWLGCVHLLWTMTEVASYFNCHIVSHLLVQFWLSVMWGYLVPLLVNW